MGEIDFSRVKRILVLNMIANTIGDSLFVTPLFRTLKKRFPESHIAVTATSTNRDLFTNNPYLDEIIYLPDLAVVGDPRKDKLRKSVAYFKSILRLVYILRREKYDLCLVGVPNFSPLHLIPLLAGIKYSVGYEAPGMYFSFLLTKKGKFPDPYTPEYRDRHYIESVLDLLRIAGIEFDIKDAVVEKFVSEQDLKDVDTLLREKGIAAGERFVAIQAGAKWRSKCWPKEKYAELCKRLLCETGVKVVLLGSPGEHALNEEIRRLAEGKPLNLSGGVTIGVLAALLKRASLVIGNDSGLMHLASAVGTKTVIIYGSTNPNVSRPKGIGETIALMKNDFCPPCTINKSNCPNNYRCMDAITVDDVFAAARTNL